MTMQTTPVIFVFSAVLLVPFVYGLSLIPDACAVLKDPNWGKSGICGYTDDTHKRTICCWEEGEPPNTIKSCQVCDSDSSSDGNCEPVYLEKHSTGSIDPSPGGGVLQDPSTGSDPKASEGGFLENLKNKMAFSKSNITSSNASNNTLAQLQSEIENDTADNTEEMGAEQEQDETIEEGNGDDTDDGEDENN
jgi:hypothetical protein